MKGLKLGHYRVTDELGSGGMGAVFRATDEKLGREVALKVLPEEFAKDAERMARFEREARVLASLNHPNIATLYGLEAVSSGTETGTGQTTFLAMELVEGEELSQRIRRGPIPVDEAIPIAMQIAEALETAHEQGIVHRDLKPANIKITEEGTVKVLDFGLAKGWEAETDDSSLSMSPTVTKATAAGVILGTAAYMSPEQARGKKVDRRADIWAFGVVLWEVLTGRKLFEGETVTDVLADVLRADIDLEALPPETPKSVMRLLRRCLEREPRMRLRHIGDALLELDEPRDAEPDATTVPVRPTTSRWFYPALAAAVAFAVAAAVLQFGSRPGPQPDRRFDLAVDNVNATRSLIPSISPDGSKALWSSNGSLWVRDFGEFDSVELPGTFLARYPFWSPDGRFVAFVRDDQVWRVGVDGGSPVSIGSVPPQSMTGSGAGSWGADGRILLAGSHLAGLFSVPDGGGEAVIYAPLDEKVEADFHHVARLPGTDAVVVSVHGLRNAGYSLQVISDAGRKTVFGGPGRVVGAPAYAPTGHLLFEQLGSGAGIWALPFSVDRLEAEGPPFLVVPEARMPSLGADGTLLFARAKFMDDRNLAWVAEDGSVDWVLDEAKPYGFPSLSPDQRKIVFQVNQAPGSEVWVHDLDRNTTTKLTRRVGINGSPLWMPDGERVLLISDREGDGWDLYLVPADGSGEPVLVYDATSYVWPTSVSSDGRFVLIEEMTRTDREDVLRLDLEDGSLDVVVSSPATEASGSLSPDDQWIAYHSDESGQLEVYVRPLATAAGRIQVSTGGGTNPMWSRRGDRLFYRQQDQIMTVDIAIDGSEIVVGRQQVFVDGVADTSIGFASADVFDVSADGSRLLMVLDDPNVTFAPRLGVIVGFLDELRQMAKDAAR